MCTTCTVCEADCGPKTKTITKLYFRTGSHLFTWQDSNKLELFHFWQWSHNTISSSPESNETPCVNSLDQGNQNINPKLSWAESAKRNDFVTGLAERKTRKHTLYKARVYYLLLAIILPGGGETDDDSTKSDLMWNINLTWCGHHPRAMRKSGFEKALTVSSHMTNKQPRLALVPDKRQAQTLVKSWQLPLESQEEQDIVLTHSFQSKVEKTSTDLSWLTSVSQTQARLESLGTLHLKKQYRTGRAQGSELNWNWDFETGGGHTFSLITPPCPTSPLSASRSGETCSLGIRCDARWTNNISSQ